MCSSASLSTVTDQEDRQQVGRVGAQAVTRVEVVGGVGVVMRLDILSRVEEGG